MAGKPIEHSYTILLPISGEALGRWLEDNSATVSINCNLGLYHVSVSLHRLESYKEAGDLSVRRSSNVTISSYGKTLEAALLGAMQKSVEVIG